MKRGYIILAEEFGDEIELDPHLWYVYCLKLSVLRSKGYVNRADAERERNRVRKHGDYLDVRQGRYIPLHIHFLPGAIK